MSGVTLLVHTHNSEETLPRLLQSVTWVEEIIAVDMSSKDGSIRLLEQANATIYELEQQPWRDTLRNEYLDKPKTPWTLVVDSDEFLGDDAERLCRALIELADDDVAGYALPRFTICFGRVLEGQRWFPDYQVRLFRTGSVAYLPGHHRAPQPVLQDHRIVVPNRENSPHIHHDHYKTLASFIDKQMTYALSDDYVGEVDWSAYARRAIEGVLSSHNVPSQEERAMEIILACDSLLRALIHWERNGRKGVIPEHFGWAFGVYDGPGRFHPEIPTPSKDVEAHLREVEDKLTRLEATVSWKITRPLRQIGHIVSTIRARLRP